MIARRIAFLLAVLMATGPAFAQDSGNLLTDANFEKAAELKSNPPDVDVFELQRIRPWNFYIIESDASVSYDPPAVTLTGGRAFLHSAAFDVEAGQTYQVSVEATGDGKISTGLLWWKAYSEDERAMAQPHWSQMEEPAQAGDEAQTVTATFEAPEGATRAYLRLEATDGSVTMNNVSVTQQ